jgi:hypothetical protein
MPKSELLPVPVLRQWRLSLMYFEPLKGSLYFSPGALVLLQDDQISIKKIGK